jgi:hypothetical protein
VWDIPPVPSSRRAVANGQSTPAIYEVALNHGLGDLGMFYFFLFNIQEMNWAKSFFKI